MHSGFKDIFIHVYEKEGQLQVSIGLETLRSRVNFVCKREKLRHRKRKKILLALYNRPTAKVLYSARTELIYFLLTYNPLTVSLSSAQLFKC